MKFKLAPVVLDKGLRLFLLFYLFKRIIPIIPGKNIFNSNYTLQSHNLNHRFVTALKSMTIKLLEITLAISHKVQLNLKFNKTFLFRKFQILGHFKQFYYIIGVYS